MRILAIAALMTAGCATVPPVEAGDSGRCDAAKAAKLVGRMQSEKTGAEALRLSGARTLRWIAPDTAVTMDYRIDRLNLRTDEAGKILTVDCG